MDHQRQFLGTVCLTSLLCCVLGIQQLSSVKNFRPIRPRSTLYRSATLDNLSLEDAKRLLDGSAFGDGDNDRTTPLATVIDLRNRDEIQKGKKQRTDGAEFFYTSLVGNNNPSTSPRWIHIPILRDVDAFWDEAIARMDPAERIKATMQTAFQGGALDRAAARNLERGGPAALYTVMMISSQEMIGAALRACVQEAERGPVIFHCQKGKDRTGVLAMLLQHALEDPEEALITAYALSGELLGGEDAPSKTSDNKSNQTEGTTGGMIDWSHFRGSPKTAMEETIIWTKQRYGSIQAYLDATQFNEKERQTLRDNQRIIL